MVPRPPRSQRTLLLLLLITTVLFVSLTKLCRACHGRGERRALLRSIKPLFNREFGYYDWNESTDCCSWEGVTCGGGGFVVSLSLPQVGIVGALDGTVFAPFTELQELDLSLNKITGFSSPPSSGYRGLEKLKKLQLSYNRMTDEGVATLVSNLTTLSELHLDGNQLLSTSWLSNLTSLKVVGLSLNSLHEFNGICNLRQLEYLKLDANMLHGTINPCLGKLQQLKNLNMASNFLRGEIAPNLLSNLTQVEQLKNRTFMLSWLANNTNLRDIVLSNNHELEIETELVRWTPLFQLDYLNLSNCIVNRRSNGIVPTFLSTQRSLSGVDLSRCLLQGRIPSWLFSNLSDFVLLSHNDMDFIDIDGLGGNMTSPVQVLDLSDNKISMAIPNNFGNIFRSLEYLDLSSNRLYGGIPSLADASSLEVLDLSFNNLSGEILPSLTGNSSVLASILLSNNDLTGPMPPFHWILGGLVHLSLENNRFSGPLSPLLPNSSRLQTLNARNNHLSGIIPDGLLSFQELGVILLAGNDLYGEIPKDLCFNNKLHFIDLSNNRFSGDIPDCLYNDFWTDLPMYYNDDPFSGNVTQQPSSVDFTTKGENLTYMGEPLALMTGIDLSMNQLSGTIPPPLGFLRQLKSLNLSHNRLVGPIPETFMYLQDMESLDLSYNHLNGSLPVQLANLSFLCSFSVACNNLSGEIPFQSQLTTFDESSFQGNEDLCGEIVRKNCSSMLHGQEHQGVVSSDAIVDAELVYWSFVAGSFALGFWGVVALLTWNAGCRRRLCALMDAFMYKLGWFLLEP